MQEDAEMAAAKLEETWSSATELDKLRVAAEERAVAAEVAAAEAAGAAAETRVTAAAAATGVAAAQAPAATPTPSWALVQASSLPAPHAARAGDSRVYACAGRGCDFHSRSGVCWFGGGLVLR